MKIKTKLLLILTLLFGQIHAQNGMPKWAFPGDNGSSTSSQVLNVTPGSLSSLPQGPNANIDYQGQIPERAFNNFTDDEGNLLFFMVDLRIFDNEGYLIADLYSGFNNNLGIELGANISIINVPGACNKYFIVFTSEKQRGSQKRGFYYLTLDMDMPNVHHANRYGSLTEDHFSGNGLPIPDLYNSSLGFFNPKEILVSSFNNGNNNEVQTGYNVLFTQPRNNERFMYLSGRYDMVRYRVTSQGFVDDNYSLDDYFTGGNQSFELFDASGGNSSMTDADIIKLENGNYKIAVPLAPGGTGWNSTDFPGWRTSNGVGASVRVITFDINAITGDITDHLGIRTAALGGGAKIKGVEFSENGEYVYIAADDLNSLYSVDLTQTLSVDYVDASPLSFSSKSSFKNGHIERGLNNKLYFAKDGGLGVLANSNDPNSNWNSNSITLDLHERLSGSLWDNQKGYTLPQNLNNENYNHTSQLSDVSIGLGEGPFCVGDLLNASLISETALPGGVWSNGTAGSSSTYVLEEGRNWIHFDAINQFGCIERLTTYVDVESGVQMELSANQYEICPRNGATILSYDVQFQDPRNDVEAAIWTKDGDVISYERNSIEVTEPGVYCVKIYDYNNACPTVRCVTIVEGPCMNLDPTFNFVKTVGQSTFTVDVTAVETRDCVTHQWWVRDITNSSSPGSWVLQGYFESGLLQNTTFYVGRTYQVMLGVWSECQAWTSSIRTVSQINRFKAPSENGEASMENVLYPNPATTNVFIDKEFKFNNYIVLNALGELVFESNDRNINLESYESGLYFVRFFDEAGQVLQSSKLIKN